MLELIVLGQIPGTHFQITLSWLLFGVLLFVLWLDVKAHNPSLLEKFKTHKKAAKK